MLTRRILVLYIFTMFSCYETKKIKLEKDILLDDILIELDSENPYPLNPNDMLAPLKENAENRKHPFKIDLNDEIQGNCKYENMKMNKCSNDLEVCSSEITNLEVQLKNEKDKASILLEKILKKENTDVISFYSRILHKFYSYLEMEKSETYLNGNNEALIYHLIVKVTAGDIAAFKQVFAGENAYDQIDAFFTENFEKEVRDGNESITQICKEKLISLFIQFQSFEVWLNILWGTMIIVFIWAFYLFILDIHRQLRWRRVLVMVFVLASLISCIIHWRHMIKVRESKRHSYLMEMDLGKGKEKCLSDNSYWASIKSSIFGGQSECEKYHENIMISASEEVSPLMVISETASVFILLPLKDFGMHSGLFFNNFYKNIPLFWQLPASLLFLTIFTLFLFAFFGYGIQFPFWMGGIRPRMAEGNSEKFKQLIQESEERMKSVNTSLMNEAKEMFLHISNVAIDHEQNFHSQTNVNPIVQNSAMVIERKLEELIDKKFSDALENLQPITYNRKNNRREYLQDNLSTEDKLDGKARLTDINRDYKPINPCRSMPIPIPWKTVKERTQKSSEISPYSGSCSSRVNDVELLDNDFMVEIKKVFNDTVIEEDLTKLTAD